MSREISDITLTSAPTSTITGTDLLTRNTTTGNIEKRELSSIPTSANSGVFTSRWTRSGDEARLPELNPGDSLTSGWPDVNQEDTWYPINVVSGVGVDFTIFLENTSSTPLTFQVCEVDIATATLAGTALYTSSTIPINSLAYYTFTVTPTSTGLQVWMFIQSGGNDLKLWAVS